MNKVIAIFDIGKTHKKILLFDKELKVVYQKEHKFETTVDEDGFECDSIELIESWIKDTLSSILHNNEYEIVAVNFSTYGASLAFIGKNGDRLTPIYNYLKEIDLSIQKSLFEQYGGEEEFCLKTASPTLGVLLNSGIQMLWLKHKKAQLFEKVKSILHFPQYLSFTLTKQIVSESTSIGCHTFLWDFDKNEYHPWLKDNSIELPEPKPNSYKIKINIDNKSLFAGIGIHDSSASLVPYLRGSSVEFLLVSTGTWCINMNPFNHTPLTPEQLKKDCLSFLSIDQKPVKSSRLFMGHIHDVNTQRLTDYFKVSADSYKKLITDDILIIGYLAKGKNRLFFQNDMPENYIEESVNLSQFKDFAEAYHRLMYDLSLLNAESIDLILTDNSNVKKIYISGGFARNEIFVRLMSNFYPNLEISTSEIDNSSALGAALVISDTLVDTDYPTINLGLKKWDSFS